MIKITTAEVIEIMLGKTLTYAELRKLFAERYPERELPGVELSPKLRTVVNSLMRSPHADIERIPGRDNKYHLKQVYPDFYRVGGVKKTKKNNISVDARVKQKVRPQASQADEECCRMAAIFNQLLMPARQRF